MIDLIASCFYLPFVTDEKAKETRRYGTTTHLDWIYYSVERQY